MGYELGTSKFLFLSLFCDASMNTWFTSIKVNISLGKTTKSQENTLQEYLLTFDANGLQLYLSGGFYHRTFYEVTNFKSTTSLFYEAPNPCLRIGDYCAFVVLFSPLNCWSFWSCDGVCTLFAIRWLMQFGNVCGILLYLV